MNLLCQDGLSNAGPWEEGPGPGWKVPRPCCPLLACRSPTVPDALAAGSPAAVLSLPTGVLEQLRSMVDDSEDTAPGLQPV